MDVIWSTYAQEVMRSTPFELPIRDAMAQTIEQRVRNSADQGADGAFVFETILDQQIVYCTGRYVWQDTVCIISDLHIQVATV